MVQLADVYVDESLTDYLSHGRYSSREEEPVVIRLLLVAASMAACTPAVPGASPSAVPAATGPSSGPSAAPLPYGTGDTALPSGWTPPPETPRPPPATDGPTPSSAPASCDPVYYDCEDQYTPRPPASAATTPSGPTEAPTGSPPTAEPAGEDLVVGTSDDGTYLVSPDGMALYTYANDSPGTSTCNGECAQAWPALTVGPNQEPVAGDGVDGTLTTITRDDGSTQVTYNDAPLYSYNGDTAAGQTNGHGIAGVWYLAEP